MKKFSKKLLALFMALTLVVGTWTGIVAAGEEADVTITVEADQEKVQAGDTVVYTVSISGAEASTLSAFQFRLKYDTELLTLDKAKKGESLDEDTNEEGVTYDIYYGVAGQINVVAACNNYIADGVLFTATFTVNDGASGDLSLTVADASEYSIVFTHYDFSSFDVETEVAFVYGTTAQVEAPLTAIALSQNTASMVKGDTLDLSVTYTPANTTDDKTVTWASSDTSVATVNSNGTVTAVGVSGTATITATVGDFSDTCVVTVTNPLTSLTVASATGSTGVKKGDTLQLTYAYEPADTSEDTTASWSSSNTAVATVDANGLVTGVADGTATITVKVGSLSATIDITVAEIHLTGISVSGDDTVLKGKTTQLAVAYEPSNTTDDTTVTWSSSDTSVATVDSTGLVTGVKAGIATITAKVGDLTATHEITVEEKPITSVTVTGAAAEVKKGNTLQLSASYEPTDTTDDDTTVTWKSSANSVATVDSNGLVTAVGEGTATITATIGNVSGTYEVAVYEIHLTGLSLNKTSTTIHRGSSETLTATYAPTDTTDDTTITWWSTDTSVATVVDGVVTAVGIGEAVIRADIGDGTIYDECIVTVDAPLESIDITSAVVIGLVKNQTAMITYELTPYDATDVDYIIYSSDDPTVATVDEGIITAVSEGTAVITLTAVNYSGEKGVTATVTVNVSEIHVDEVAVSAANLILDVNDTDALTAIVGPSDTTDEDTSVTWSTSDASVVAIEETESGVTITALKPGEAVITATSANGVSGICEITVLSHIDGFQGLATYELNRGDTAAFVTNSCFADYGFEEDFAAFCRDTITYEYSSDNTAVATVAADGTITGVAEGTATITATMTVTYAGTSLTPSSTIVYQLEGTAIVSESNVTSEDQTTIEEALNESIEANTPAEDYSVGDTADLNDLVDFDEIFEEYTDDVTVTWEGDNDEVAVVNEDGTITFVSEGEVTVTATVVTTDGSGNVTGTFTVSTTLTVSDTNEGSEGGEGTTTGGEGEGTTTGGEGEGTTTGGTSSNTTGTTGTTGTSASNTSDTDAVILYMFLALGAACIILAILKKRELRAE